MIRRIDLRGRPLRARALRGVVPRAGLDVAHAVERVRPICDDVRDRGVAALVELTERFDGVRLDSVRVPVEALQRALAGLDPAVREALEEAIRRTRVVHRDQRRADGTTRVVPGGTVTVGRSTDPQRPDQGILTERGGAISLFAADSVNVGTSRIFTLRGGDEMVWSDWGDIAAGSGSKTVHSAPPTRVLFDPQSANVQNDLAGLATGSGIGVLATLVSVKPGDVDLIAPVGTIDAGDAGIRSSGNLNLAAHLVLNANNIQVSGTSAGTPPPPAAPNLGSLSAGSSASAVTSSAATELTKQATPPPVQAIVVPSIITVEVLGFGGGEDDSVDNTPGA